MLSTRIFQLFKLGPELITLRCVTVASTLFTFSLSPTQQIFTQPNTLDFHSAKRIRVTLGALLRATHTTHAMHAQHKSLSHDRFHYSHEHCELENRLTVK